MQMFGIQWKWNIPNGLSLLRLALIPAFAVLYLTGNDLWSFGALALSGVTDFLDGYIARHYNQITDCGKLLDPVADKLTQVTVVMCLAIRYPRIVPLAVICFGKELCQGIGGLILLRGRATVRGSKWYGKVSTVLFYICMAAIVLWDEVMPDWIFWSLVGVVGLVMLYAFISYFRLFIKIHGEQRKASAMPLAENAPAEKQPEEG